MKTFIEYLREDKNLHMEHAEDELFNRGSQGAIAVLNFFTSLLDMLEGNAKAPVNVTVKWDGAPAVFCGINPENGKFFVATKSLFNVVPKINYTNQDIDMNHSGNLASKLKIALEHLPKLGIRGILQGDMLFTPEDVKIATIDGEKHYVFTPNTITYAVPVNSDIGNQIKNAKLGIVFHTEYRGKTIKDLKASFGATTQGLRGTKDVWATDAMFKDVSGTATFTSQETAQVEQSIDTLRNLITQNNSFIDEVANQSILVSDIKIYGNSLVRQGDVPRLTASGFIQFYDQRMQSSIDKLKSDSAKSTKDDERKSTIAYLTRNADKLDKIFRIHSLVADLKIRFVRKFEQVKNIGTFIKTNDGFRVTTPEGFVAIDKVTSRAIKLVDRMEFSRLNFNVAKNWDKK